MSSNHLSDHKTTAHNAVGEPQRKKARTAGDASRVITFTRVHRSERKSLVRTLRFAPHKGAARVLRFLPSRAPPYSAVFFFFFF
jgi:hypothetical protein